MKTITIATFNQPEPARPVQQRLDSAGIHAEIHDAQNWKVFSSDPNPSWASGS